MRELSHGLLPVQVDAEGLIAALEELAATITNSGVIRCDFEYSRPVTDLTHSTATHLFRIVQEAVNNAVRHSQARRIVIRLEPFDGHVLLEISDDGTGIDPGVAQSGATQGTGLRTMYYRASQMGAHLEIDALPGGGTCVRCVFIKQHHLL